METRHEHDDTREDSPDGGGGDPPTPQCSRTRENLGARLDGELRATDAEALASHLEHCDDCRKAERELLEDWSLVTALPEPELDAGELFLRRLHGRWRRQRRVMTWRFVAAAAAAVVLLAATLVPTYHRQVREEEAIIRDLGVIVDLYAMAGDLDAEALGELFGEDTPAEEVSAEYLELLDLLLEEELSGDRS